MGQIIGSAAKPKRCNLSKLSQLGTPAAGEHILVSSDNSMNAAGQGNFDCYIVGDGTTAATALELKSLADNVPTSGSKNSVSSGGVYNELHSHSVTTNQNITPTTTRGYFFSVSNSRILITANSGSFYTSFGGDTSSPVGIDISAYVGSSIVCKLAGNKATSSVRALIVATESNAVLGFVKEQDYTLGSDGKYYASLSIPQGAKYVYWSAVSDLYSMEIVRSEEVVGITERVEALEDATEDLTPSDYVKKHLAHSVNLYNKELAENGFMNDAHGTMYSSTTYVTSDYIPVTEGEPITVSPRLRKFLAFDKNKSPITSTYQTDSITQPYTFVPTEDGFIRVSFWASDGAAQVENGTEATSYTDFWEKDVIEEDVHISETMTEDVQSLLPYDLLKDKKWVHCGDSFSDYTNKTLSSGSYSGRYATFPRLIAERNGMTLEQTFMLSGRTIGYPSDGTFTNSLTCPSAACYFQNIPADVDYVTIMLGINDINHRSGSGTTPDGEGATGVITLGTIDSFDTSTYYGAFNTVLTWLRTNRPFAHVGIIITNGLGNTTTATTYKEAQIALAKKYGYPYLDLNGDQHTPAMNRYNNSELAASLYDLLNTNYGVEPPSNTHPNWQAHEYESTFIEAWLRSL